MPAAEDGMYDFILVACSKIISYGLTFTNSTFTEDRNFPHLFPLNAPDKAHSNSTVRRN